MPRSITSHIDAPAQLGLRLRQARERAGLSQRQLSFPGCTAAYISRLEAGARVPSLQMINELATRLSVSPRWLATGVESAAAEPTELVEADVALRLGDLEEAERLLRTRLAPGDPAQATALAGLGQIAFKRERYAEAIDVLRKAFDRNGGRALAAPGLVDTLARAYAATGARESAIALLTDALEEARAAKAMVEELRFAMLLANALIDNGNFGEAGTALAATIRIADELQDPITTARVFWSQARLHSAQGNPQIAARYARRALDILERTEHTTYIGMAYHMLAYIEIEGGNGERALELLERGRSLIGTDATDGVAAKFAIEEARALVLVGRVRDAARAGSRALEYADALSPGDRGRAFTTLAEVFLAADDDERGRMLFERGLELLVEHGKPYAIEAGRRYADVLEAAGDTAGALRVLRLATDAAAKAPADGR
ncbi:MAG TPA: tetratricopeptide repeat protein [Gaiellaceae bacterium]|nr:tetratricopeptide repeat protein [Gaiellaceae bacterium]